MENHLQNPAEVPNHPSVVPDALLINVVLVKRGEDLVSKQVAISQTLFRQSPMQAASQIFPQIDTKFLPEEQRFLEHTIAIYSGIIRTNNLDQIFVYIIIMDTVTDVDGEERVTLCMPMIFLNNPREIVDEQFINFSGYFMRRIQKMGSKFKLCIIMVNEVIRKYGDSMQCEEVKEDRDCSICLTDYTIGSQTIRLPCDHSFCTRCTFLWLLRNGSCPLCRYRLIPESPSPVG